MPGWAEGARLDGVMDTQELNRHIAREIRVLQREFAGTISADEVERVCEGELARLHESAAFNEFIPLLVHRRSRELLVETEALRAKFGHPKRHPVGRSRREPPAARHSVHR